MREVTIFVSEGKLRLVEWADRDNPTESELHPEGSESIMYTIMPHDFLDRVRGKTEDAVNEILQHYFIRK